MTEEQAKTKWCPMEWFDMTNNRCIASGCMMWKWGKKQKEVYNEHKTSYIPQGYCGLAGTEGHDAQHIVLMNSLQRVLDRIT